MGMTDTVRVEAMALVERLSIDDIPAVAAILLDAWCGRTEATHDSITLFVNQFVAAQGNDLILHVLMEMMVKYDDLSP